MNQPVCLGLTAQLRLLHVREFLAAVDRHFPEGIPLEYSAAIRHELEPIVVAAQLELLETELADLICAGDELALENLLERKH
jgi:hypothetical protein